MIFPPLSVLDLAVVGEGTDPATALHETADMAQAAERLGYHRFWVPEHHSFPASASPAPAVLLAHLGGLTSTIRLGSGGVMLPNHVPLLVAEQFGVLNALHPGRIDLGVGRNPGALPGIAQALHRTEEDPGADAFARQVEELRGFLGQGFPDDHPYTREDVHVVPRATGLPVWMLGSGDSGADVAARFGLPFAAAQHINAARALPAIDKYRAAFRPSDALAAPYTMVSVNVVCADTDGEALGLARSGALMMALARQGIPTAVPTPRTAAAYDYRPRDEEFVRGWLGNTVHGSPETVRARLAELQERTRADEFMLTSLIHGFEPRKRSYELVAEEFGLKGTDSRG
ncbi:LLM class flavin-dependent oxidoreductase [Streptomyces sp. NBC_01190]|uniref:LLM class flavin-dependent oxidoreductase n=1 Tax=Streptomyces sp. NBC_01190 TaxID=2903767 RepID=UPI0038690101|nr:LLM class flavin-dependent oxidoreductase [Streptomyces sp. NBC_01190]